MDAPKSAPASRSVVQLLSPTSSFAKKCLLQNEPKCLFRISELRKKHRQKRSQIEARSFQPLPSCIVSEPKSRRVVHDQGRSNPIKPQSNAMHSEGASQPDVDGSGFMRSGGGSTALRGGWEPTFSGLFRAFPGYSGINILARLRAQAGNIPPALR